MVSDSAMRASDRDRERAAEVLCDAYAVGRLDLDEFHERAGGVYLAKTWGELCDLTADLPTRLVLSREVSAVDSPSRVARLTYAPQPPSASVWVTVVVWLAIATAWHAAAVVSLVLLSLLVLRAVRGAMRAKRAQPSGLRGEEE
jgi:hypothetical protein